MACSTCDSPTISFSVPADYREYAPENGSHATVCTRCLTLEAAEPDADERRETPEFARISDAFPPTPERAIPLVLALDLCSSLATNRSAIESLLREVERAGADPLLVIDRLQRDRSLEPVIDLDRRAHQLEQLLY